MTQVRDLYPRTPEDPHARLAELGLSVEVLHAALRPGFRRALGRTDAANPGAPANDIYQDGSEQLRQLLMRSGWDIVKMPENQIRVVHPEGRLAIVVASADHVGVVGDPKRIPITRPKGPATIGSLPEAKKAEQEEMLNIPGLPTAQRNVEELAQQAPLWMLLHELIGTTLNLELSEARGCREGGRVDKWGVRIPLPSLTADDDTFPFNDDSGDDDGIDVPVIPR